MILGYARVSTREQAENSQALEQQVSRLERAGAQRIITDVASGGKDDRPGLSEVMALVKAGEAKQIIITRLDRLARSILTTKRTIDTLRECDCSLVALDDSIDMGTSAGRVHIGIMGVLAEAESDMISERVRHGWAKLREKNVAIHPPFGYKKARNDETGRYQLELDATPFLCVIDEKEEYSKSDIGRFTVDAFLRAKSIRGAIREVNEHFGVKTFSLPGVSRGKIRGVFKWSPSGLRNWITSPVLRGHTCYLRRDKNGKQKPLSEAEIHHNTHPEHTIMNEDEFRDIQGILASNKARKGYGSETRSARHPLSGLVRCAQCRRTMHSFNSGGRNLKEKKYYYQCSRWRSRECENKKAIRMDKCEDLLIKKLCEMADIFASKIKQVDASKQIPELSPEQQELQSQLDQLNLISGNNSAIEMAKINLQEQINNLGIKREQTTAKEQATRQELAEIGCDEEYWRSLTPAQKRSFYRIFIKHVWVDNGEVIEIEGTV